MSEQKESSQEPIEEVENSSNEDADNTTAESTEVKSEPIVLTIEPPEGSDKPKMEYTHSQVVQEMERIVNSLSEDDQLLLTKILTLRENGLYNALGKTIIEMRLKLANRIQSIMASAFPPIIPAVQRRIVAEVEGEAGQLRGVFENKE